MTTSSADEKKHRNPPFDLPVFNDGFTPFPQFLIDQMMPYANGIPASFWKYMLVLWRELFGEGCVRKGYRTDKVMTQFQIDKDTASQWTAALHVSGLFKINYGFRYKPNEPGIPTTIQYRADSTVEDWRCFITALRDQILHDKRQGFAPKRKGTTGFRIALSFKVDEERERSGLPRLFADWHKGLERDGVLRRVADGRFEWERENTNRTKVLTAGEKAALVDEYGN